jgi:hypothetical protein
VTDPTNLQVAGGRPAGQLTAAPPSALRYRPVMRQSMITDSVPERVLATSLRTEPVIVSV